MTTIRLLDARRGLNRKCEELFKDAKIAEAIYRFLCDGIEECEDVNVPERNVGKWIDEGTNYCCSECHRGCWVKSNYCPWCGADMRKETEDE